MDWKDKVVLVTGASRGIGAAAARLLAQRGANIAVSARSSGGGKNTIEQTVSDIEELGGHGLAIQADITIEEETRAMVERAVDHFGRLDMLVNNAALTGSSTNLMTDTAEIRQAIEGDLVAPIIASQQAIPHFRKAGGGRILNITSLVGMRAVPDKMMYGVNKIALERLTLHIAQQFRKESIACNAFRIDLPVREQEEIDRGSAEGSRANNMEFAEPGEVAAEGMVWMLEQPFEYTGRLESMRFMREREGNMRRTAKKTFPLGHPVTIGWPMIPPR